MTLTDRSGARPAPAGSSPGAAFLPLPEEHHRWTAGPLDSERGLFTMRLLIVLVSLGQAALHLTYTIDDAAISYAYARSLAAGAGFVFQPGDPPVEGATNLLWVGLLALGLRAGLDALLVGKILGLLTLAGTVWLTATFPLSGRPSLPDTVEWMDEAPRLAAAAFVAVAAPVAIWAVAGLETALFGLLLLAAAAALARGAKAAGPAGGRSTRWLIVAACCLLAASLTRPEGVIFAAVTAALLVAWRLTGRRVSWLGAVVGGAVLALGLAALTAWRLLTFGYPLPNTYYAKAGERTPGDFLSAVGNLSDPGWAYLARFAEEFWLPPVLLVTLLALPLLRSAGVQTAAVFLVAGVAAVLYEGGDNMIAFRFLAPLIPLGALTFAGAVGVWVTPARRWPLLLLVPAGLLWLIPNLRQTLAERVDPLATYTEVRSTSERLESGLRSAGIVAPTILTPDVGGFAYPDGPRVVDLGRLVDPTLAHNHYAQPVFGRYIFEQRQPDLIRTHHGWTTESRLLDDPAFKRDYLVLRQWTDGGSTGGEYLRRAAIAGPIPATARRVDPAAATLLPGLRLEAWEHVTVGERPATLRLWLYWTRTGRPLPEAALPWRILNRAGSTVSEGRHQPLAHLLPPDRWPENETIRGYVELPLPKESGNGPFQVEFSNGRAWIVLGIIDPESGPPAALGEMEQAVQAGQPSEALAAFRRVAAGRAPSDPDLLAVLGQVRDAFARRIQSETDAAAAAQLAAELWPFTGWGDPGPALRMAADTCAERSRSALGAGQERAAVDWLICATDLVPGDAGRRRALEDLRAVAFDVRLAAVPPEAQALDATLGRRIRLAGYSLAPVGDANSTQQSGLPVLPVGRPVTLTLYFERHVPVTTDYEIFVHIESAGGRHVADHYPSVATSRWRDGEIIADSVTFQIPVEFEGPVTIWTGVWDRRALVPVTAGTSPNDGERVRLGTFALGRSR